MRDSLLAYLCSGKNQFKSLLIPELNINFLNIKINQLQ